MESGTVNYARSNDVLPEKEREELLGSLTDKQWLWLNAYLNNGYNATEAARTAGYKGNAQVLTTCGIKNRRHSTLQRLVKDFLTRNVMSREEALVRLSIMARASLADFFDVRDDGTWKFNLKKAKERGRLGTIKKLRIKESTQEDGTIERTIKIELHDALQALDRLLRAHGAYDDGTDVTESQQCQANRNGTSRLREKYERAADKYK